ncbi:MULTISPECIES: DUF3828 domain-containing protein [Buttiauxella]|uniref:DUF3828 domain-containing protein n=1 Tax=Buttiauxella TaxID=82976 RepID=UPI001E504821|nr:MULTISPECIES: DUF3828 domain-containing protein [Buttiauxella]MCE0828474.1 YbjP/YqhG family protein [Buttiauxella ferragutiae]
MKILTAFMLLVSTSTLAASDYDQPIKLAQEFNQWYLQQISQNKNPLTDGHDIDKYVTKSTLEKLRSAIGNEAEFYDADFFIRAQDFGEDWPTNVTVVSSDYDPVCFNIYVSYGKKQQHTVIDCMVKESGTWKIQSVAGQTILRNENVK